MVGLVLSVATIGCVKSDGTSTNQSGMMTLQLSNGTLTTRAVGTNDDTNNEDLIANAQVFFFNSDAADATVKHSYYTSIGQKQQASMSIPLSADQLSSLFPGGNGYVYVIANYGSEISATTATTLEALKKTVITSTFGTDADGVQDSFIMDSELVEVTRGDANTITGEVFLTRAAAKVELTVNVAPITQDGKQWIADTANMRLSFNNGVSDGVIDDGSDEGAEPANGGTTFDIADRGFTLVTGELGSGSFVQTVPFYSYSTKWTGTAGDENEVYLELAIPWKVQEQSASESEAGADSENVSKLTYQTFYYQVPVSVDDLSLVRNAYYKLTLDVGVLGGLTERVTVEPSYVVVDWGTNEVNVDLSRPKYLVVDENYVKMNNVTSYSVGYQSSDAVTAYIIGFECRYYYDPSPDDTKNDDGITHNISNEYSVADEKTTINDVAPSLTDLTFNVALDSESKQVILSHNLDNTMSTTDKVYHYFPYKVTVRITNTETGFYEDVIFQQFPALFVNSEALLSGTKNNNVMVNARSQGGSYYTAPWMSVADTPSAASDIYTVSVSAFDATTADYLICDPRDIARNITNFPGYSRAGSNNIDTMNVQADVTGDKEITGYRPTIAGQDAKNLVAPEFKVASSCGTYKHGDSRIYAETSGYYRCAGYQEAGYPAGRWRIPTPAELNVIGRLCAEGKVASIFINGVKYMSSDGPYTFNSSNGTFEKSDDAYSGSIRCVYDSWYWKDKVKDTTDFVWAADGDIANGAKSNYLVPVE